MKIENPITWCDETTNAVTGCEKVSEGCRFCYAQVGTRARVLRSQGIETWGPKGVRYPVNFEPVFRRLNKLCVCDTCHNARPVEHIGMPCEGFYGHPMFTAPKAVCPGTLRRIRLFADSNSDWLDEKWPIETLVKFLESIRLALNLDVILLTKRPENLFARLQAAWISCGEGRGRGELREWIKDWQNGKAPNNVWIGVSVENQAMANKRIPILLTIPATVRFLSAEPLLENVDLNKAGATYTDAEGAIGDPNPSLTRIFEVGKVDWVIVGAESGPNRRDCGVGAVISIASQCQTADIPVFVKQDTAFYSGVQGRIPDHIFNLKQFPKSLP